MTIHLPANLKKICLKICHLACDAGGKAFIVGGCVRDGLLDLDIKDIDMEVFGIEPDDLEKLLSRHFQITAVGKSFGVFKIKRHPIDIAIPRRESKSGHGHKGFAIKSDPSMTFMEAASRRDFSINAMGWDPLTGEILDPQGGQKDLENRLLRHTSDQFSEDPLRVLRGMQFCARFNLKPDPETIALCRTIEPEGLSDERIFEEWRKLIVLGKTPSRGLDFIRQTGWVKYFPELHALIDCEQDPEWHPEGDVWNHTLHCMDAFARENTGDAWEDLIVGLAVLCHDFGKPETTAFERGRIRSPNHEAKGERPARHFLERMTRQKNLIEEVIPLVTCHMRPNEFHISGAGDGAVRRLARRVGRIDRLIRVAWADMQGRPPVVCDDFSAGKWLLERSEELAVRDSVPSPIILGRHLIDAGLEPGPGFKSILNTCYEAQLDGEFEDLDRGLSFLQKVLRM